MILFIFTRMFSIVEPVSKVILSGVSRNSANVRLEIALGNTYDFITIFVTV